MAVKITNQKPIVLSAVYHDNIGQPFDPCAILDETVVNPLFSPVIASSPVKIADGQTELSPDDIRNHILACCGDGVNPSEEAVTKDILGQCLVSYDANSSLGVAELYPVQSACASGLPEPTPACVYTPAQDVIPMSRQFITGSATYDQFFASLAFYARPETLGFYFVNEVAFDNFVQWFQTQTNIVSSALTPEVNRLISEFCQLKLDGLTESLILRKDDNDALEERSFPRILISLLMNYSATASPAEFGILPFNLPELVCPKTVVFVNVERHSRASAKQVADEWKIINSSLQAKNGPRMVSNKQLTKLTAQARALKKIQAQAVTAAQSAGGPMRANSFKFTKTCPSHVDITRAVKKVMDKMAFVNTSMNTYKSVKSSFAKPNRRDPDDWNKQGKIVSTRYKPDIHLYIDCSGSISERDYQDAVKACIALAKKYNVNMYFNSFADTMSQTTRLHLQNKSAGAAYAEFQKIPKVTGGTDYEQIWHFINKSKKRCRELSLIITDFEWWPRTAYIRHPKNLYYAPCSTSNWQWLTQHAEDFCKAMVHNEPNIRAHLLF